MAEDVRLRSRRGGRLAFHGAFRRKSGNRPAMNSPAARFARLFMMAVLLALATVQPALAQDDDSGPSVLRDTETELMFKEMSRPLILAGGLDPNSVNVVLLNDPEINAFVARGQTVYVQSGLLEATDNVNQLQGVVAHELGHVIA